MNLMEARQGIDAARSTGAELTVNPAEEVERNILADIHLLKDPFLQYAYLIECGRRLEPMPESAKCPENLIRECEVSTWVKILVCEDRVSMQAYSDSLIVRGALALISEIIEKADASDIHTHEWKLLEDPDFAHSFTKTQLNGLSRILGKLGEPGVEGGYSSPLAAHQR